VLPVYFRFLTFEAWQCCIWGLFYLSQSYYDWSADGRPVVTVLFQLVRYLSSFTMAVSGEGVFFFLACRSASSGTLMACFTAAAMWACLLSAASAVLFLWWAGCTPLPSGGYEEILWLAGWFPYYLRLAIMPFAYTLAGIYLLCTRPALAWERGALPLALFNLLSSSVFVLSRVYFGVLMPDSVRLQDGLATPLIWIVYVPFLIVVLQRDSDYWCRAGFMACIVEEGREISELKSARREARERTPLSSLHTLGGAYSAGLDGGMGGLRSPLIGKSLSSTRVRESPGRESGEEEDDDRGARFVIVNPAHIQWGRTIGRGASSMVSSAVLYGHHVAIKELKISYLTREFATAFLAEAEFLSRCRHPNIVAFIGGCVSPPKVALIMELCRTSVHSIIHCRRTRAFVLGAGRFRQGQSSGGGGGGGCGSAPGGPTAVLPSAAVSRSERERARQQQPSSMGGLPTELVCQYLHDVIRGMRFLHHTMGIVHGDLKPLNMLLKNGSVKLCDFGCASSLRAVSSDGFDEESGGHFAAAAARYVGTLPYCAPEIIESPRRILPSADVYSFGVALWEMCTGLFPWEGLLAHNRHKELKQRVVTFAERPDAQSCPAPLQTLMKACWTAAPLARPTFEVLASIEMCTLCSSTQTLHQLHLAVWKRFQ